MERHHVILALLYGESVHIMRLNSIPRTLLKILYPPGYEYIKQILAENMNSKTCTDVMHNGGVTIETAEYEPDQIETFKLERMLSWLRTTDCTRF